MTIQNLEITSIEGKRFIRRDEPIHQLNISSNSSVTLVNQTSEDEAEVEFRYTVDYRGVGFIKIEGRLVYKGEASELVANWAAKKNMPDDVAQQLHNAIMGICIPQSVIIAKDLNLMMPIPMPKVDLKKAKTGKGGDIGGMEVA